MALGMFDSGWVVIDHLAKSTHFLLVKTSVEQLASCLSEILSDFIEC